MRTTTNRVGRAAFLERVLQLDPGAEAGFKVKRDQTC
jgi:hypothetical protein